MHNVLHVIPDMSARTVYGSLAPEAFILMEAHHACRAKLVTTALKRQPLKSK